jgi:ankyrin repeat protein
VPPLVQAVLDADLARLEQLLGDNPDSATSPGFFGSALHLAAQPAYPAIVHALLAAGADPNTRDLAGNTPLHIVVSPLHPEAEWQLDLRVEIIRDLMQAGANPNARNLEGQTPLDLASSPSYQLWEDGEYKVVPYSLAELVEVLREYQALPASELAPGPASTPDDEPESSPSTSRLAAAPSHASLHNSRGPGDTLTL